MTTGTVRQQLVALAATVAVAVAVVIALLTSNDDRSAGSPAPARTPSATNVNLGPAGDTPRRADDDPLVLGSPDAPVTMVVFEDFRCEYCAHFTRTIQPALIDRYVDTGVLRIEWRDAPMAGPQSRSAARAGRAAAAQGHFWAFVQTVMEAAPAQERPDLTPEVLTSFARQAGVDDLDRFERDMRSDTFDSEIESDLALAKRLFIPPVPAFWINGTPLLGGLPLQVYVNVIEGVRPPR
jgi:protein-disulfide isomerase